MPSRRPMPAVFVGHGSPMNAVAENGWTRALAEAGRVLPRPRSILVISAHWLTVGIRVGAMERPRTIHDFDGFPDLLYSLSYPCPGAPDLARDIVGRLRAARVQPDRDWGLDHGAWMVLRHMYPDADIPVCQLSLEYSPRRRAGGHPLSFFYSLGKDIAPLRDEGVLILGSGNVVHNLNMVQGDSDAVPFPWAEEFDRRVASCLLQGDHDSLLDLEGLGDSAALSHPTLDHYLPLVVVLGLQREGEQVAFLHRGIQHGSVSMMSFRIA